LKLKILLLFLGRELFRAPSFTHTHTHYTLYTNIHHTHHEPHTHAQHDTTHHTRYQNHTPQTTRTANLKNGAEEHFAQITQLERAVNKAKAELHQSRVANLSARAQQSRVGTGQTPVSSAINQQPSSVGGKKLYSKALSSYIDKRYKLTVKRSRINRQMIKSVLKTKVNPTEINLALNYLSC
jgi:hypothetical protein